MKLAMKLAMAYNLSVMITVEGLKGAATLVAGQWTNAFEHPVNIYQHHVHHRTREVRARDN